MKEVNAIKFEETKVLGKSKYVAKFRLSDDCKNGVCEFAATMDIYRKARNGRWVWESGGCQHEELVRRFPWAEPIVRLHLCHFDGSPTYAVENGFYFIEKGKDATAMKHFRVSPDEYELLEKAPGKDILKYLVIKMGLPERWKSEADACIAMMEERTDCKWVDPYTEHRHLMEYTDEWLEEMRQRDADGEFTPEALEKKKQEKQAAELAAKRQAIVDRFNADIKKEELESAIRLALFDAGATKDNEIYYSHKRHIVLNWKDFGDMYTDAEFNAIVERVDRSMLPDDCTIELKHQQREKCIVIKFGRKEGCNFIEDVQLVNM